MIKATNPLTGKFDFVADNIAEKMRKDIAFKGYRFEPAGPDAPESKQVEAPAEPPEVNMPESYAKGVEVLLANPDEIKEGVYETFLGKIKVTNAAKRRN